MRSSPLLAIALALAACREPARAPECPGETVARLRFSAVRKPGSACTFAASLVESPSFGALVAFDRDGSGAALCLETPRAVPHLGTHQGDRLAVGVSFAGVPIAGCSCAADVAESVEGTLLREGEAATGFAGTLTDRVAPAASLGPVAGDCGCGLPCEVAYDLEGRP